jgi:hypothetical protein
MELSLWPEKEQKNTRPSEGTGYSPAVPPSLAGLPIVYTLDTIRGAVRR